MGAFRMTEQRRVILDEIQKADDHPSADQIYERVRHRLPRISLGTVYRNLDALVAEGLVARLESAGRPMRFDGRTCTHQHLRCTECDRVDDVFLTLPPMMREPHGELKGYCLKACEVEFRGLCPDCRDDVRD